jgi:fluoroacetyl-CoA thioesterase
VPIEFNQELLRKAQECVESPADQGRRQPVIEQTPGKHLKDMTTSSKKAELAVGRILEVEWVAGPQHSAENFGNPGVPVFATPAVVWLLDSLAHQVIVPTLDKDQGTLGTKIDIEHLAATPMGMKVRARAEVIRLDGKRVLVKVEAHDESEMIARGTIERYITGSIPKFLERTYAKKKPSHA